MRDDGLEMRRGTCGLRARAAARLRGLVLDAFCLIADAHTMRIEQRRVGYGTIFGTHFVLSNLITPCFEGRELGTLVSKPAPMSRFFCAQ